MTRRIPAQLPVLLAAAVLALCILTGCSDQPAAEPATPAPARPSAAIAAGDAETAKDQAHREILAAYNGYLEAYIAASAVADYHTSDLKKYVAEPLLGQLLNNLHNMSRSGVHNEGRPSWSPTVTELRLDGDQAVIQDCLDSTKWNAVGGKAKPSTQAKKYPVVVKAKRVNTKWYVYESTAQRTSRC